MPEGLPHSPHHFFFYDFSSPNVVINSDHIGFDDNQAIDLVPECVRLFQQFALGMVGVFLRSPQASLDRVSLADMHHCINPHCRTLASCHLRVDDVCWSAIILRVFLCDMVDSDCLLPAPVSRRRMVWIELVAMYSLSFKTRVSFVGNIIHHSYCFLSFLIHQLRASE